MTGSTLRDHRILVVEDEYLIAMDLQIFLDEFGVVVVGPVPSVEQAMALIRSVPGIEAAVIDVNLGGEMAYPVADVLIEQHIPFVFTSGYAEGKQLERYPEIPACKKPYGMQELANVLAGALTG